MAETRRSCCAPARAAAIPTGLAFALPDGFEGQVRPRSGLAARHGVSQVNTPGTIDADYRGEVKVILINLGEEDFTVRRGDRIAQLVIAPVTQARWNEVASLDETARGEGGFGSTGGRYDLAPVGLAGLDKGGGARTPPMASSMAWAIDSTLASPPRGPINCTPTGRPAAVWPAG